MEAARGLERTGRREPKSSSSPRRRRIPGVAGILCGAFVAINALVAVAAAPNGQRQLKV